MTLRHAFALCAALLLAVAAPSHGLAADDAPVEGRDYVVIPDGQPWQPADGRIEVADSQQGATMRLTFPATSHPHTTGLPDDLPEILGTALGEPRTPGRDADDDHGPVAGK